MRYYIPSNPITGANLSATGFFEDTVNGEIVPQGDIWNPNIAYPANAMVVGADGQLYIANSANLDSAPPADVWREVGSSHQLAENLASASGASEVGFVQAGEGAVPRNLQEKVREQLSATDFPVVGDGVTDDTAAIAKLESSHAGRYVDLLGKTYLVSALPTNNYYFNGTFKRASDGFLFDAGYIGQTRVGNHAVVIGKGAGAALPKFIEYKKAGNPYNVIAIGDSAMAANTTARNSIAIGVGAMQNTVNGRYNIAIGLESQYCVNSNDGANTAGTRNIGVGDNTLRFNVTGYSNIAMGRNAGQSITNGNFCTALGSAALYGLAPLDLDDTTILNQTPLTVDHQTMIGSNAGMMSNAEGNTCVGADCGSEIKKGTLTAFGWQAASTLEVDSSFDGFQRVTGTTKTGTYVWNVNTITVTIAAHGFSAGWRVRIGLGAHEAQYMTIVSVPDANTFTLSTALSPTQNSESGVAKVIEWVTLMAITPVSDVMAIGRKALYSGKTCSNSIAIGAVAQFQSQGINNTSVGNLTLSAATTGTRNTAVGYSALRALTTGTDCVAVGEFAASNITTGSQVTALGRSALRNSQDGSVTATFNNITGVGYDSRVSGDNQVQLGNSATTTYVYGTVQNRSDLHDKADVRDTVLGLDFIKALRPVDYRWDMRDDYAEPYEEEDGIDAEGKPIIVRKIRQLPKDGSKKRARFHHGLIAQEVQTLIERTGVDFGGFQNHAVDGGCDVKTIGYDELIAPLIKAVQELASMVDQLRGSR
ncbi:tail fiber domain-containing protein [Caballeronia insecticola]|uniref:Peptidase S74 domain-containing protein n=1 Tax=Caballeronia insecticola TaxID=758793 RepID=R4WQE8_9BURK|nr:tail fiber domain-containing protein [Caballeronia insecticola]BAN26774.1 putative uncharacterized protein [Caballeronia insecticola]